MNYSETRRKKKFLGKEEENWDTGRFWNHYVKACVHAVLVVTANVSKAIPLSCEKKKTVGKCRITHGVSPLSTWVGGTTRCRRWPSCSSYATGSSPCRTCCCSRRHLQIGDHTARSRIGSVTAGYDTSSVWHRIGCLQVGALYTSLRSVVESQISNYKWSQKYNTGPDVNHTENWLTRVLLAATAQALPCPAPFVNNRRVSELSDRPF